MTPEGFLASKQVTLPTPHGCVELVRMKDALEAVRMCRRMSNTEGISINKACEWIENFLEDSTLIEYKVTPIVKKAVTDNFRKYMEG